MNAYGGVDVQIHIFLTSVLAGSERSAPHTDQFTPGGKSPRYPLDRRMVGPQIRSGQSGEEKFLDRTEIQTATSRSSYP
jgi:hypothetical protein